MEQELNLNELAEQIFKENQAKGFWSKVDHVKLSNKAEKFALIHSEISEALEADRKGNYFDEDRLKNALNYPVNPFRDEITSDIFKAHVKDTMEDELADAIIMILDFCGGYGIDIEFHIKAKLAYNRTREHKHGKKY